MDDKDHDEKTQNRAFPGFDPEPYVVKDAEAMAINIAKALEQLGKAASAWLAPLEAGEKSSPFTAPVADAITTLSKIGEYWLSDPKRSLEAQTNLLGGYFDLWMRNVGRASAYQPETKPSDEQPGQRDKRFQDDAWRASPFFSFIEQTYRHTSEWAERLLKETDGLDPHMRLKAEFYLRQLTEALSPSNFVFTNPKVYRETVSSNAENLVRGMKMFAEDVSQEGFFKVRHTNPDVFEVGRDLATTPGKVIAQNALCQIIQYEPTTSDVLKRPLLIVPPWINKFYILDLGEQKSFVKWSIDQGHTVFMISWVNPDSRHGTKGWRHYISEGIDFALDTIAAATGEREVNAIGYCVAGTLLSSALALHAAKGDERIRSATLLAAQVDFEHAGDLKVFVDEPQVEALERQMHARGYLDGAAMATAFNMLRASELIWPYMVNNYLRGQDPLPFDILHWNADSTRVTAANHSFYLRNCYLDNRLSAGEMVIDGQAVDLGSVKIPIYNLATREDHIAPARSVYIGMKAFGGQTDFVLGGAGHVAGVINAPTRNKYQFWANGSDDGGDYESWLSSATETSGSWWPHWHAWVVAKDDRRVPARSPGGDKLAPIEDAPGSYVMTRY